MKTVINPSPLFMKYHKFATHDGKLYFHFVYMSSTRLYKEGNRIYSIDSENGKWIHTWDIIEIKKTHITIIGLHSGDRPDSDNWRNIIIVGGENSKQQNIQGYN